jgi:hypothetical protein
MDDQQDNVPDESQESLPDKPQPIEDAPKVVRFDYGERYNQRSANEQRLEAYAVAKFGKAQVFQAVRQEPDGLKRGFWLRIGDGQRYRPRAVYLGTDFREARKIIDKQE